MAKGQYLGEFEHVVLLAIARLRADAYGARIRREVEERTERSASVGAIYATLDRLAAKGYVATRPGPPEPDRGGRPKRFYSLEPGGETALMASRRILERMWDGVELGASRRQ